MTPRTPTVAPTREQRSITHSFLSDAGFSFSGVLLIGGAVLAAVTAALDHLSGAVAMGVLAVIGLIIQSQYHRDQKDKDTKTVEAARPKTLYAAADLPQRQLATA